tara:strand:+ start:6612 stop:6785 length:174 start_codon:yes stop_codon:yes gene_type:complete
MSIKWNQMEFIVLPFFLLLWYLAYDTKPTRKDEIGILWEQEFLLKRMKIKNIINDND